MMTLSWLEALGSNNMLNSESKKNTEETILLMMSVQFGMSSVIRNKETRKLTELIQAFPSELDS